MATTTAKPRAKPGRPAPASRRRAGRRVAPPLEHRILMTATLCLIAFGAVMVYSASSPPGVLNGGGSGTGTFVRYLAFGAIGLAAMYILERRGMAILDERLTRLLLLGSFGLLLLVMVPGFGKVVLGARRWFALGPIQFQPSELMKLALVLHLARYLADHPRRMRSFREAVMPIAIVAGPAILLIVVEPDLGTALVVALSVLTLLFGAGMPMRWIAIIAGVAVLCVLLMAVFQPYQRSRLTSFLAPAACAHTTCYQSHQGQIALGSGGFFGVGLGKSVAKIYYLPEAQNDFILAVIGEELGVVGVFGVIVLYGMIAYGGLRTARRVTGRYAKLLATGLTSLILCQGTLNIFVVLGLAPLTGVPLPFISYAPSNLCVMLASIGLLLNLSRPGARRLTSVKAPERDRAADRDRRRRDRGTRRSGAGGGRRAAG